MSPMKTLYTVPQMSYPKRASLEKGTGESFLEYLPKRIRAAIIARAADIEYPIEAVMEEEIIYFS